MKHRVYGLFDETGELLDTCRSQSEEEAMDWFSDVWDTEGYYAEEIEE